MRYSKYASIILDVAIDKTLDYGIPEDQLAHVQRGMRVAIPIRGKLQNGYVFEIKEQPSFTPVKPIAKVLSEKN